MGREIAWGEFTLEQLDLEHHELVISVARSAFAGRVVLEGASARLAEDPRIRKAYLGLSDVPA
ncbi:MAG: hypothetical protein ACE5NC_03425 [Anaerolineae bacterium]